MKVVPQGTDDKSIMNVVLQMQNTQMEMMQMLREVKQEIFRIRENNTNCGEGYGADLNEAMVSFSMITKNIQRLKYIFMQLQF